MRHPYEKFIRIELFSIVLALTIFIFALIKGFILLIICSLLLISISLLADSLISWLTHQKAQAIKQCARAVIIFILAIYIIFVL